MATPDTASPSSPFLDETPSPKTDMMQIGGMSQSYLLQEQLSLQEHLTQQQDQKINSSSYVCEWMPTHLCLPSSQDAQQDKNNLCLPVNLSESSYYKQNEEKEEYKDDGYCSDTAKRLRLMALDHYLARVSPLALSAKKLLHDTPISEKYESHPKPPTKTSFFKAFQNTRHRRAKRDRQSQLPSNQTTCPTTRHRLITSTNSGRVINVLQGEIAHCTPSQADTLVSDDATTCHIVALWSCKKGAPEGSATLAVSRRHVLATMTHIDGVGYETSIRDAVNEHIKYHSMQHMSSVAEECKENASRGIIEMAIHIVGGFNDDDGSSIEITDNVLQSFASLSNECNTYFVGTDLPRVNMTLETCAVSSGNDDGNCCPLGRGMGLEVATGRVFLAEVEEVNDPKSYGREQPKPVEASTYRTGVIAVDGNVKLLSAGNSDIVQSATSSAAGPEVTLRSTRLWASAFHSYGMKQQTRLHVIHQFNDDCLSIEPFFFCSHRDARRLLDFGDEELLSITSTSPGVEKSNFVSKVRQSLTYLNGTSSARVFFAGQPMKFKRVGLNSWVRVS